MESSDESKRIALGVRELVNDIGKEARDSSRGRGLRSPETVREILAEEVAWALLCGIEPRLKVDEEGSFYTITDLRVLDDKHVDLMGSFGQSPATEGLMPLQEETLDPTIPEDRWRRFLASDDQALALLAQLEKLVANVTAPDDFSLPLLDRRTSLEGASDEILKERVRRLAWLIRSRNPDCLNLLADLLQRRNRFVWGSEEGPWAERNNGR